MTWIVAEQNFSWKPTPNSTIDFKVGQKYNMPREQAEKLIADGKAKATTNAKKNGNDQPME